VNDRGPRSSETTDARLIKAFTHPLRRAILARLDQAVLSPKDLAGELSAPLSVVSYHVKELLRLDLIELVRTEQRRGAIQHWYRGKSRGIVNRREFQTDKQGFDELAEALAEALERIELIQTDAARRLAGGEPSAVHATVSLMLLEEGEAG
jgi:DNA-binding transcriptional ArsR family regulator